MAEFRTLKLSILADVDNLKKIVTLDVVVGDDANPSQVAPGAEA